MSKPRVAVIGLGLMGNGMARRVLGAGFPLAVYNRDPRRAEPLVAEGARPAATPRAAAEGAQVVLSMVADDAASRSVWTGSDGALAGAAPGSVLIESSTSTVGWIEELAQAAAAQGCELLDAPVTGSRLQAEAGELLFLVGGSAATLEAARPVLAVMSRAILHLGPTGRGAAMKLANNFVCGAQAATLAEGLALAERAGIAREHALDIFTNGAAGSPLVKNVVGRLAAAEPMLHFRLRLMAKDLAYAQSEAARYGLDLATARAALQVFERAIAQGRGDQDLAAVLESV